MALVPSTTASQQMTAGSNTGTAAASMSGPSAPGSTSTTRSASSKAGASPAASPHGAMTKLEPQNTSRPAAPTPPTPMSQAPMASASPT